MAAVEKNLTGSTAKDLFEDALEVADAQFDKDKALLKDAAKDIPVQPDSTFDQFNAALEDIETVKNIIKPNRCAQSPRRVVPGLAPICSGSPIV